MRKNFPSTWLFTVLFSLSLFSCSIEWFSDYDRSMEEVLCTEYTFILPDPTGVNTEPQVFTKKLPVGQTQVILKSDEIEDFEKGYMLNYLQFYSDDSSEIPSFVHTDSDNHVLNVTVTREPLFFKVDWIVSDHTKYYIDYYLENLDVEDGEQLTTENCDIRTEQRKGTTFEVIPKEPIKTFTGFTLVEPVDSKTIGRLGDTHVQIFYSRKRNTLFLDYNGGTFDGNSSFSKIYKYESPIERSELPQPLYEGYKFQNWQNEYGDSVTIPATMPETDISLLAVWKKIWTVTYIGRNGETVQTKEIYDGDLAYWPDSPFTAVDESWHCQAWYSEDTFQTVFDLNSYPVTQNLTLYSKWVQKRKVTYHKNDGSAIETEPEYIEVGQPYSLLHYKSCFGSYGANGKYFLGWATSETAATPEYYAGDEVSGVDDLNLYAVYTNDYFTVTVINAYNTSEKVTAQVGKGTKISFWDVEDNKLTCPAGFGKGGGYSLTPDSDGVYWNATEITSDITVYQHWELWIICHNGYLDSDGNENMSWYCYKDGKPLTYPASVDLPTRPDYTFQDFFIDAERTTPVNFESVNIPGYGVNSSLDIYAKWSDASAGITVTLGNVESDPGITISADASNKITANIPSGVTPVSFCWKIDGEILSAENSSSYTYNPANLEAGIHYVFLEIKDSNGFIYTAHCDISVQK